MNYGYFGRAVEKKKKKVSKPKMMEKLSVKLFSAAFLLPKTALFLMLIDCKFSFETFFSATLKYNYDQHCYYSIWCEKEKCERSLMMLWVWELASGARGEMMVGFYEVYWFYDCWKSVEA